ncbi:MAG TPA: queuosine precursor transporter [Chlamydiales bacterium]|nr:queuosine precursor transporter [Chlamydiales bacterium]
MTNEILFFIHIFVCVGLVFLASRIGKKALVTLIVLQAVFANLFVVKQMSLFGFSVTCSDVFAIGGILGLNLFQEKYGKEEANRVIKASFLGLVFFMIMSKIHLLYTPLAADTTHEAFVQILSHTSRITIASIGVYWIVQKIDVRLFAFLKTLFTSFPLRVGISLVLTQFLDTVLFSIIGLYGVVDSLFDVIVLSFFVKCIIIFCCTLVSHFAKRKYVPV